VAAVQQAMQRLKSQRSGPRAILEELIEESMVEQECARLGLKVTQADVDRQWQEWDQRLRKNSNHEQTLLDVIKEQGMGVGEFRAKLAHILRKERIAEHPSNLGQTMPEDQNARLQQVGIVIGKLRTRTQVEYGVSIQEHVEAQPPVPPAALPKGVVAAVNGQPIAAADFGKEMLLRLPSEDVREMLDQECKTALMAQEGVRLADEEVREEIAHLERLWPLDREFQQQVAWRTVTFTDRFEAEFKVGVDDVLHHRYYRGLFGLVRRMRATVTDEDVVKDYDEGKASRYGPHLIVTDIKIDFAQESGVFQGANLRSRRLALETAKDVVQTLARDVPFKKLVDDINAKRDRTFTANEVRLYDGDRDRLLYDHASKLRDGDVSAPFETLAEVHVVRREESRPGRALEEIRPLIVERLARLRAREWLEKRVNDPAFVRVRWPLPERTR
jgi:hypothetical protein